MKLGGLLRPYPVNISPRDLVLKIKESREFEGRSRRIGVFSKTQEIQFKRARDYRGFGTGSEAREFLDEIKRVGFSLELKKSNSIELVIPEGLGQG